MWTRDAAGVWRKSGSGRACVIAHELFPPTGSFKVQLPSTAGEVSVVLLASQDGRWCFECGVGATDAFVRRVTAGRASAAHTPPVDILVSAAHGVAAGVPLILEGRLVDGRIHVLVDGEQIAEWDNVAAGIYATQGYCGFASSIDGAAILSAEICALRPVERPREDNLVWVGGSELWRARAGGQPYRVARVAVDPAAEVTIVEAFQRAYIIGGGRALVYNLSNDTVEPFTPTAGTLPGQVGPDGDKPGRTTATVAAFHASRLHLAGMPADPQNDHASAFGEVDDWDTGDLESPGRAFSLGAERAGRIGQPIRAMLGVGDSLIYGCDRSVWLLKGDPVFDNAQLEKAVGVTSGVSGRWAMAEGAEGNVLAHSPAGLIALAGAEATNVSRERLRSIVEIEDDAVGDSIIIVATHPDRPGSHLFLTRRATDTEPFPQSTHLYFDHLSGSFWPDRLPPRTGPTAACVWNGRLRMGTRDGYIVEFDDGEKSDFDSAAPQQRRAIGSRVCLSLLANPSPGLEQLVTGTMIVLGDESTPNAVRWSVYAGVTAQEVYEGQRWTAGSGTLKGRVNPIAARWRAGAMLLELSCDEVEAGWSLEVVEVDTIAVSRTLRRTRVGATAPGGPCGPPSGPPSGSGSGSGPGFGSGPGSGGSGFTGFSGSGSGSGPGGSGSGGPLPGDGGSGIGSSSSTGEE